MTPRRCGAQDARLLQTGKHLNYTSFTELSRTRRTRVCGARAMLALSGMPSCCSKLRLW